MLYDPRWERPSLPERPEARSFKGGVVLASFLFVSAILFVLNVYLFFVFAGTVGAVAIWRTEVIQVLWLMFKELKKICRG